MSKQDDTFFKKFYSFERALKTACQVLNPKLIVEWGSGYSTILMLKNSKAHIFTYENSEPYYTSQEKKFAVFGDRVSHYRGEIGNNTAKIPFMTAPLRDLKDQLGQIDLCFIDSNFRLECVMVAYHLIKKDGLVVQHDVFKDHYDHDGDIFPYSFLEMENERIGVYSKTLPIIEAFKKEFNNREQTYEWRDKK